MKHDTKIYQTHHNGTELKYKYKGNQVSITRNGEIWGSPQGERFVIALLEDIEKYRKEIIQLRGKAHLSCPSCLEDCMSWVVEGKPCCTKWNI